MKTFRRNPVIIKGIRTPFIKAGKELSSLFAHDLGRLVTAELLYRTECDPELIDSVIFGAVSQPAEVSNIARVISLSSGIPARRTAHTVQLNCASGMQAIINGAQQILLENSAAVLCGAVESVSNIPLKTNRHMSEFYAQISSKSSLIDKARILRTFRPEFIQPVVAIAEFLKDGYSSLSMGQTADYIARKWQISRESQDDWAFRSHRNAREAQERGYFSDEIFPLFTGPAFDTVVEHDLSIRMNQSLEVLKGFRPYFDRDAGTVTRGNMAPLVDGATALLLMDPEKAKSCGYRPEFCLKSWGLGALKPQFMGLAAIAAMRDALRKARLTFRDIQLFEINEVFAAHILTLFDCLKNPERYRDADLELDGAFEIDRSIVNVNGGSIAIGHSLSASSMRIVIHLMHEMSRRNLSHGLATTSVNGGQAVAIILERL